MEPKKDKTPPRVLTYTQHCKRSAQGLFRLLELVSDAIDRAHDDIVYDELRDLLEKRHLFAQRVGPIDPEAVEPIHAGHHRAHLHPSHPLALLECDPRRTQELVLVGEEFNPLAYAFLYTVEQARVLDDLGKCCVSDDLGNKY